MQRKLMKGEVWPPARRALGALHQRQGSFNRRQGEGRAHSCSASPVTGMDVPILGIPFRSLSGNSLAWKRLLCLASSAQRAYSFRTAASLLRFYAH